MSEIREEFFNGYCKKEPVTYVNTDSFPLDFFCVFSVIYGKIQHLKADIFPHLPDKY